MGGQSGAWESAATLGPADPEHDSAASYALDSAVVRFLQARLTATSTETTTHHAPFTGQPLATLPVSTTEDVAAAFRRARAAQLEWSRRPVRERAEVALAVHDLLLDRQEELLDLVQWEAGKARAHAYEEVADAALTARYYGRTATRYLQPARRRGLIPGLTRVDRLAMPVGVVGVIAPWNYPLSLALGDALTAVVAGNGVVLKPDPQGVLTALAAAGLAVTAGVPADLWQVVHGDGRVVGATVVDLADYVCFTGSTAAGREVARRCGERLIGCSLELGGKNPMLVLRDADVERAAEGAVRGCFASAGQLCLSVERLYVADACYAAFLDRFLRRVRALRLSASFDFTADMGPLMSARQLARVQDHVDDAVGKGARVLAGGRARPDVGTLFYEPTVLDRVTPTMDCFDTETFGPVVAVYGFADEADGIARANEGPYGLNASVWTRDARRGRRVAARIKAGTVNVNEAYAAAWGSVDAPLGGRRESGLGRRHGPEGLLAYTEAKTVATQRLHGLTPPRGVSPTQFARAFTGYLRWSKRLGRP